MSSLNHDWVMCDGAYIYRHLADMPMISAKIAPFGESWVLTFMAKYYNADTQSVGVIKAHNVLFDTPIAAYRFMCLQIINACPMAACIL